MEKGEKPPAIQVTLTKLFDRKSGANEHGEWSIQNGEFSDGQTAIPCMFKDRPEISKSWKGRELLIECHRGEKGLNGIVVHIDTHDGKTKKVLRITPTAEVSLVDGGPAPAVEPQKAASKPSNAQQQSKPQQAPPPQEKPVGEKQQLAQVMEEAYQVANLQLLCWKVIDDYSEPRFQQRTGRKLTSEERQQLFANMVITLKEQKAHWKMPKKAFAAKKQEAKPQTPPPAEKPEWKTPPPDPDVDDRTDLGDDLPF